MTQPKLRFLHVKTSKINDGHQVIVICTDITKLKEMEKQGQKLRATFFSSVAHELRTPLNSILPILQMILEILQTMGPSAVVTRLEKNVKVALNSAKHLQSLVEDALDMMRIENNQFTFNNEIFDLRKAVDEVCEIMQFQLTSKALGFDLFFSELCPQQLFSDAKRIKQILFNFIGNAIKFTFQGKITLKVSCQ